MRSQSWKAAARVPAPAVRGRPRWFGRRGRRARGGDAGAGAEGALVGQVEGAGAGAEDLAKPVGGEVDPGGVRVDRHALAAPAGESGTSTSGPRWSSGSMAKCQPPGPAGSMGRARRGRRRAGSSPGRGGTPGGVQAAARDLRHHVRGRVEDVLVGRGARGASLGVYWGQDSAAGAGCLPAKGLREGGE
jgi:hypothetical protein